MPTIPGRRSPLPPARRTSPLIRPWFGIAKGREREDARDVRLGAGRRGARRSSRSHAVARSRSRRTARTGRPCLTARCGHGRRVLTRLDAALARAVFDVMPGRMRLEMSIEDSSAPAIDTDVRDFLVGDLRAPVAVGTPEVLRARTATDVRAIEANPDAVPVASREFSRGERLVIRVPVYAPVGVAGPVGDARQSGRAGDAAAHRRGRRRARTAARRSTCRWRALRPATTPSKSPRRARPGKPRTPFVSASRTSPAQPQVPSP